ncbi:MAG: hypothetical protein V4638_08465 [Bacteroidota bacterium]
MNIFRNALAVVLGLILGSIVNMGIIMSSSSIIPPPVGSDLTTMEGLTAAMQHMEAKHFLFPFLAHALGTFTGALVVILVAANRKKTFAFVIASCFFVGGFINVILLPSPLWFNVTDLAIAYFPMAWMATRFAAK